MLDECVAAMNDVLGSRFLGSFQDNKKAAETLDSQLTSFSIQLDEWVKCQRSWMYLENIFRSQDIQRDRATDYRAFEEVHKKWVTRMKQVNKSPNCSRYAKKDKFFKVNIEKLEAITASLERYLEEKRSGFPRFYMISNDELLLILAAATDLTAIDKHLNKVFEGISSLNFVPESSSTAQVLGFNSPQGESFLQKLKIKSDMPIEDKMKLIEEAMFAGVRLKIYEAMKAYEFENDKARQEWVLSNLGQAVGLVSRIIWNEACESAFLETEEGPMAIQDLFEMGRQQLGVLVELARTKVSRVH